MNTALKTLYAALGLAISANVAAQLPDGATARFTFNNGADHDEVSGKRISIVGARFTEDRFGNKNNAIYVLGDSYSYVNLGSSPGLKPGKGTISLWVKLDNKVHAGKGYKVNPILLTKNTNGDDFYEAYSLHFDLDCNKLGATQTKDSTHQTVILSPDSVKLTRWYHLVLAYDDQFVAFYVDGELVNRSQKNYKTVFESSDSVIIGVTNNRKNQRSMRGSVDDIFYFDRVLTAQEVETLYNAPDPDRSSAYLKWTWALLGFLAFTCLLYWFIRHRLSIAHRKEKKQLELQNLQLETELRVNRALMNPHFVFNSLNALQSFILKNDYQQANRYLVRFSKLIRRVLESNMNNSISLDVEIEMLERYLEIEDMRFEDNIVHEVKVAEDIQPGSTRIPIMMIQPFVENSIWHGLLRKEGEKRLTISFSRVNGHYIRCTVDDNGHGRKKQVTADLGENKSLAIRFIEQRLRLLNRIHKLECGLTIEDKPDHTGTTVRIDLPILN